jgi:hypothetical protein
MPQLQLPIFPDGVTHITNQLAFMRQNGQVTYGRAAGLGYLPGS